MAVLVMSFFEMAKSELNASLKDSDNVKARSYADAAVNIVISQIREATTQKSTSEEYAPWSSQPGAIRVYQPYGDLKAIYKLYSSSRMLGRELQQLERDDLKKDWQTEPEQWVDANAPVVLPSVSDEKDSDQAETYYPIADPRVARPDPKNRSKASNTGQVSTGWSFPAAAGRPRSGFPCPCGGSTCWRTAPSAH